jgi:hypothetical protein
MSDLTLTAANRIPPPALRLYPERTERAQQPLDIVTEIAGA